MKAESSCFEAVWRPTEQGNAHQDAILCLGHQNVVLNFKHKWHLTGNFNHKDKHLDTGEDNLAGVLKFIHVFHLKI